MQKEIKFFDEKTKKFYKLVPTKTWPTLEISGIHMHRIKEVDPKFDSILKVKSLGRIYGKVLDTCTGLGYTAILAARKAKVEKVFTVEKDSNVIKIARLNPFSKELFESSKIVLIEGDVFEEIKNFQDKFFDFIIHDPPRISLAPELYSKEFYSQLFRVLKNKGKIFHYIGKPGKLQGKNYLRGIVRRLKEVGFRKIKRVDYALGLIVQKF
ncbi:MAG: methyltransferase [Candidatus Aenigmarchaeota archaeon]|nr:methyltransferase [Candidatus Aenigmarchaeota archaeon]